MVNTKKKGHGGGQGRNNRQSKQNQNQGQSSTDNGIANVNKWKRTGNNSLARRATSKRTCTQTAQNPTDDEGVGQQPTDQAESKNVTPADHNGETARSSTEQFDFSFNEEDRVVDIGIQGHHSFYGSEEDLSGDDEIEISQRSGGRNNTDLTR